MKEGIVLRPKQQVGFDFIKDKKIGIIGMKTGQGKSLTIIQSAMHHIATKKQYAVIMGPKKACERVWPREIKKWTNAKYIYLEDAIDAYKTTGNWDFIWNYKFVICRFSHVKKYENWFTAIAKRRITIVDEIHKMKNPNAAQTQACFRGTRQSATIWGLTATVLLNSILDLWGVVSFLDPHFFGPKEFFQDRFCVRESKVIGRYSGGRVKKAWETVDYKNLDILREEMAGILYSTTQDLKVNTHHIEYAMSDFEFEQYLIAADGALEEDRLKGFAQRLPDIQKVADGSYTATLEISTRKSSKYIEYHKKIEEILKKGESIVMFSEFYTSYDYLHGMLTEDFPGLPVVRISGKHSEHPPEGKQCLILATAAASESLNLQFANHVFMYSIPFSVGAYIQLVGRIAREDSEFLDDLNVYLPKNDDNIDRYKFELIKSHANLISDIIGTDENLPKSAETMRIDMMGRMRKELLWMSNHKKRFVH